MLQNSQKCRVLWYNCHRTHRSVGYCIQISQGNLCGVPDVLQNSQKCRVLWCNCHRTHRSIGYCGTAVTELTEVLCRVKTEGNYPRYRSVGTIQKLSVEESALTLGVLNVDGYIERRFHVKTTHTCHTTSEVIDRDRSHWALLEVRASNLLIRTNIVNVSRVSFLAQHLLTQQFRCGGLRDPRSTIEVVPAANKRKTITCGRYHVYPDRKV